MGDIERCWIWERTDPCDGQVQRGVMFHEPQASRNYFEIEEFVPAEQFRGAVETERARIIARLGEMADAVERDEVARTRLTLEKAALVLELEGGQ
jgi:hypothetical protein